MSQGFLQKLQAVFYRRQCVEDVEFQPEKLLGKTLFFYIHVNYYNNGITYYYTNSNYFTILQGHTMGSEKTMTTTWPIKRRHITLN